MTTLNVSFYHITGILNINSFLTDYTGLSVILRYPKMLSVQYRFRYNIRGIA